MVTGIIGKKVGMTQLFHGGRDRAPATVLQAGPCVVVQAKMSRRTATRRCSSALSKQADQGEQAHRATSRKPVCRRRVCVARCVKAGGELRRSRRPDDVSIFADGERVDVIGTSRGKGFQGIVKRHHFRGGEESHGSMFHRAPGSIGASSYPVAGGAGDADGRTHGRGPRDDSEPEGDRVDAENNLLLVEGAVPGGPTASC